MYLNFVISLAILLSFLPLHSIIKGEIPVAFLDFLDTFAAQLFQRQLVNVVRSGYDI